MLYLVVFSSLYFLTLYQLVRVSQKGDLNKRLLYKVGVSVQYLVVCVFAFRVHHEGAYFYYVFMALVLSFFGDLFLGAKHFKSDQQYLKAGIVFFTITQVLYAFAFSSLVYMPVWLYLLAGISALVLYASKIECYFHVGNKKAVLCIYFAMVLLMAVFSVNVLLQYPMRGAAFCIFAGAWLFFASDMLLLWKYFRNNPSKHVTTANMLCYYVAQYLLAVSVYFYSIHAFLL